MAEVAVCIPTYNGACFLRDCLDSVVNQSFQDLEILVVDDHSSDNTDTVVAEYAAFDDRIRFYRNSSNLGLVGNWNAAIAWARAPWIKLVFQDDLLTNDCIGELHACANDTGAQFVGCFRHFLFEDGVAEGMRAWYLSHQAFVANAFGRPTLTPEGVADLCLDHFAQNWVGEPTVTLIHRDVFDAIGWFDPAIAHRCDAEFWCRAGTNVGIAMLPKYLATFRVHAKSTTSDNLSNRAFANEMLDPLVMLMRYLGDPLYASLRAAAVRRGVWEQMRRSFDEMGKEAHRIACLTRNTSNSSPWREWCRVVSYYPQLAIFGRAEN